MSIIDKHFVPENIQQLKELAKHVHLKSGKKTESTLDHYKCNIEKNLIELSNHVDSIGKTLDNFITQINIDLEAQENMLHDTFVKYKELMEFLNKQNNKSKD